MNWTNLLPDGIYEYESPFLHVWVDSNLKLMYSEWLSAPSVEQFCGGVDLLAEWLQSMEVENWIQDLSKLAGVPEWDQQWAFDRLVPGAESIKFRRLAWVSSSGPIRDDVRKGFLKEEGGGTVEIGEFETYKAAADWIARIRF